MIVTEKAFAVILKDIGTTLHMIGTGPAPGLSREYNIAKANYFYSKAGKT